jgi:putative peptide zinc metalloprotease protein
LSLRPRLGPGIVFRQLSTRDETYVIVKDAPQQKFFKFEVWEQDMLQLLDGSRTLEEIDAAFRQKHPEMGTDLQWTLDYLEGLKQMGLLERTDQERHLIMMDKVKTLRKRRFYDAEKSTLMQISIPMFDPDRLMDRIIPWIRFWWSPWFVAAWMGIFAVVLGYLIYYWDLYWTGFFSIWNPAEKKFGDWVFFLALLFGVSVWHELGHGFACKRYGGEVHDIGFMIFYLQPSFYCGVDDSYIFPKQSHRLAATFGGPYFELMLCSVAAAVWLTTPAEWWIHSLALTLTFFTGLSVILMNVNPLIKLDGYYILMDWLDVPDLREESFEYLGDLIRKKVFHLAVPVKPIPRRRRRIYLIYGLCSVLYLAAMVYVIFLLVRSWLVGWLGPAGYLALFVLMAWAFRKKIGDMRRFVAHLWLDKSDWLKSRRGRLVSLASLAAILVILAMIPTPTRLDGSFVVEPVGRAVIRAPSGGIVEEVMVEEGSMVAEGDALAVLRNPELLASRNLAEADARRSEREAVHAREQQDIATYQSHSAAAQEASVRLALLEGRVQGLTLRATRQGIVSTVYLKEREGSYLRAGEEFCSIEQVDPVWLAVSVSEAEFREVKAGVPARLLLTAFPERPLEARVLTLSPVAVPPVETEADSLDLVSPANRFRVLVEVPNSSGLLRAGMSGRIQFLTRSRTLVGKTWWHLSRWAGMLFW